MNTGLQQLSLFPMHLLHAMSSSTCLHTHAVPVPPKSHSKRAIYAVSAEASWTGAMIEAFMVRPQTYWVLACSSCDVATVPLMASLAPRIYGCLYVRTT